MSEVSGGVLLLHGLGLLLLFVEELLAKTASAKFALLSNFSLQKLLLKKQLLPHLHLHLLLQLALELLLEVLLKLVAFASGRSRCRRAQIELQKQLLQRLYGAVSKVSADSHVWGSRRNLRISCCADKASRRRRSLQRRGLCLCR